MPFDPGDAPVTGQHQALHHFRRGAARIVEDLLRPSSSHFPCLPPHNMLAAALEAGCAGALILSTQNHVQGSR